MTQPMQSSRTVFPIQHPKRIRKEIRSWKHRTKRVHQSRIVSM